MCLTAHLPALPVPGGAAPPPIIKYISLYATYLHPIHPGKRCPSGPRPGASNAILSHCQRQARPGQASCPIGSRTKCEHVGPQALLTRGKSTAIIRPNTRKETHTTPSTHTGERPQASPGPDTPDSRGGEVEEKSKSDQPGGQAWGTPWPSSLSPCCPVAHLARGEGARAPGPPPT